MQFAPLYPLIHRLLKPTFPTCLWTGKPGCKLIALTFDDGPHPLHTQPLLEVLAQHQVTASFFWIGVCVERFPDVARSVWQAGHWIGLHGYQHHSFPLLSATELQQSLQRTQAAIAQACQLDLAMVQQQVRDVRPPNGVFTPQTLTLLQRWGYRPVMWSVVPEDWVRPGVAVTTQRVLSQTQDGSVIVLHDGHHGGEDVAAVAAQVIPALLKEGYQFVSIEDLWNSGLPTAPV